MRGMSGLRAVPGRVGQCADRGVAVRSLAVTTAVADPRRRLGLDALRGVAVVLMIEQHVGIWLWRGPDPDATLRSYAVLLGANALGGLAAPLFIVLAGVGAALYTATGRRDRTLVVRGAMLIGFGLLLNVLAVTWFSWSSWFVLHMLGVAVLLAVLWRRWSTTALLTVAALILAATPLVQTWLDTPVPLDNARMGDAGLPGGALRLALAEGHFPVLPWLALAVAGFVAGRWLVARRPGRVVWLAVAALAIGTGGHLVARTTVAVPEPVARAFALHLFYPASVTVVLLLGAVSLLLVAAVHAWERRRPIAPTAPLVTLGRSSLTLLLVHVPLFRELTQVAGVHRTLPATATLVVVALVLVAAAAASRWWQRHGYRYGAEWALRQVDGAGGEDGGSGGGAADVRPPTVAGDASRRGGAGSSGHVGPA